MTPHDGGVSIHAPAWGATIVLTIGLIMVTVSIHAPAWGATTSQEVEHDLCEFQSMPPRGGQLASRVFCFLATMFQSMPPRGGQPCGPTCDLRNVEVSIHAPAWGATGVVGVRAWVDGFNPCPRVGGNVASVKVAGG